MKRLITSMLYACIAFCSVASADTKITYGYTATSSSAAVFIAKEQGFFKKRGLDVEPKLMFQIIPALASNSINIGGITAPPLLQAVENGLPLVVLMGGDVMLKSERMMGLARHPGVSINSPSDLIGKKVGVQGLNAFMHVLLRKWLMGKGVDYNKVRFVEVQIPQMRDVLKSGSVDAIVVPEPLLTNIVNSGAGSVVSYLSPDLPNALPSMMYGSTREWAEGNRGAVSAFRAALDEALQFLRTNPQQARVDVGKYLKLPPNLLALAPLGTLNNDISAKQLAPWLEILREQKMLKGAVDPSKVIFE